MTDPVTMVEVTRGPLTESVHRGHAVICGPDGAVIEAWGDAGAPVLPRSSCKMVQALPLVESGAADRARLTSAHLALACASHNGAAIHTDRVTAWLRDLGLADADLRCGAHMPDDPEAHRGLLCSDAAPCQVHNNCSGKHTGFLTLSRDMGAGPDYLAMDHPVQRAVLEAFEEVTGETSPGHGIDGCSAPNHVTTVGGLARAMSRFATAGDADTRGAAMVRLREAMVAHPDLVAGEGRACTALMRACSEPVALKTGAEGVYVAILPARGLGVALKIADGTTRASQCAIAAILVRLGALDPAHPAAAAYLDAPVINCRGFETGRIRAAGAV